MKAINLFLTVLYLISIFSIVSQESLDEVIVSSPRLNTSFSENIKSLSIITAEEIENLPVSNLTDLLRTQAGIEIRSQGVEGSQADIYIRGGTFDQVLILIDGIRVDDPQTGHHTLNSAIPLEVIERIEIIKGPSARVYGHNALTGAINIVTKKYESNNSKLTIGQGSFNYNNLSITKYSSDEDEQHVANFSTKSSNGYRYNSDFKNLQFFTHSSFVREDGSLKFLTSFNERKFGANGFYGVTNAKDQYEETQSSIVAVSNQHIKNNWTFKEKIFWKRGQDEYIYIRNNPAVYRNLHINNKIGFSLDTKYNHKNEDISGFGFEFSRVSIQSNNLGDYKRTIAHLFYERKIELKNFTFIPGLAFSNFSDVDHFLYPGIDIGYKIRNGIKLNFNSGYTYRVPSYTDLYYNGPQAIGNKNLKPEKAFGNEIGIEYFSSNLSFETAFFIRKSENLIDYVEVEIGDPKWLAQNIHTVETTGLEFVSNYKYNIGGNNNKVILSYSYLNDNFVKTVNSRYALNSLKHSLNIISIMKISKQINSTISYRYAKKSLGEDYNVLDAKISYVKNKFNFNIQGSNLLGTNYYENLILMPKSHVILSLSYNFN